MLDEPTLDVHKNDRFENDEPVIYKYSPTCYHEGIQLALSNKKQYCRISDIRKMIERNQLTENDIVILKVLLKYEFLTRFTLSCLIAQMNDDVPKRANYKNALSKLVKNGVVLRYYMTWSDYGTEHTSPCFYTLSLGAREYMKKVYALNEKFSLLRLFAKKEPDVVAVLKAATINQYHCSMMLHYKERIFQTYLWFDVASDNRSVSVPCVHRYKTHIFGSGHLDIICMPVRSNAGYKEDVLSVLNAAELYIKSDSSLFDNPLYILLCENSGHARQLDMFIKKYAPKGISCLYLLDRNIVKDAPLEHLLSVQEDENGYFLEVQRLHIEN